MRLALVLALGAACGGQGESAAPAPPIKFLHTFNPSETELFNKTIADRGWVVDASLVPFARGHQVITEILRAGNACPDLIRIDATWLPGLVAAKLLVKPPEDLVKTPWASISGELASLDGVLWAVPQTIDGLVVVRQASTPAPKSDRIADLVAAAKASPLAHPLGVRVDGYWVVPWLRAEGVELAPAAISNDGAVRGLASFAGLFGTAAAAPPSAGSEAPEELRRWNAHELAYWVTGPWQLCELRDRYQIEVSRIEHAPRGGQLLVVPACAAQPAAGWKLAKELTSESVSLIFSDAFATIPTLASAQGHTTPLVQRTLGALITAELLPRTPVTPLLFDDLNPAVAAAVAGDATPEEAVAGVRHGWHRLEKDRP